MDDPTPNLDAVREAMQFTWSQERSRQLYGGLGRRRRRHFARSAGVWSAFAALVCALGWVILPPWPKGPAPVASKSRAVEPQARTISAVPRAEPAVVPELPSAAAAVDTRAARDIKLADGSNVHMGATSELRVVHDEPTYIELELERGSALFDVVPNKQRAFSVSAGKVRVTVLGTVFTVERKDTHVRVGVTRGKVRVSVGARATTLRAGQTKSFSNSGHTSRAGAHDDAKDTWRTLSDSGDYTGAYRMISAGADVPDEPEALMDAADAARLSHHPDAALSFLQMVVSNHATSPVAPQAAFMLGQLLQRTGAPLKAAGAFRVARELEPEGSLAQDALAREVEAWSKAGRSSEAQRSARMYEERYPGGRWLDAIRAQVGSRVH